jgi:hypothetical protein
MDPDEIGCEGVVCTPSHDWPVGDYFVTPMLPKLFSTATQFLERQSVSTHIALLDKKSSSKKEK